MVDHANDIDFNFLFVQKLISEIRLRDDPRVPLSPLGPGIKILQNFYF